MEPIGPPGIEGSTSVVVHDPFDEYAFDEILPRAPGLNFLLAGSGLPMARELAFDLFCSFYKYVVKLLPHDRVVPEARRHRELLARAIDLREHEKLRSITRLKAPETALATEFVLDALLKELARTSTNAYEESAESPDTAEDTSASADLAVGTERLREVFRTVGEDLRGAQELVAAWSAGPGQEIRLPPELKLRMMRDLVRNPRMSQIASLFGRYRRLGLRERELRAVVSSEEVVDFIQGGDVARALAGELSSFATAEREDLFYAKVVTHSLLIYDLGRRERKPRPVYLCLDNSGSMAGDKEVWAKAVSLALAQLAIANGRPVEVVLFGDAADPLRVIAIRPEDDGPTRLEKVMDLASYFLGGGTDFAKPLSHVLDVIRERDHSGNDVLFVSDGLCPLPDEFVRRLREEKERYDVRLTSVLIGGDPFSLRPVSDVLHRLDEVLAAGEALAAHFASSFLERVPEPPLPSAFKAKQRSRAIPLVFDHFFPGPDEP